MYLLDFHYENAKKNQTGRFIINQTAGKIQKWTMLSSDTAKKELLRLIVLSLTSSRFLPHIPYPIQNFCQNNNNPLKLQFTIACHSETEKTTSVEQISSGIVLFNDGTIKNLKKNELNKTSSPVTMRKIRSSSRLNNYFLLGYGSKLSPHINTDDFEFNNPFLRVSHFHSLFNSNSKLTDPIAFLNLLQYRGVRHKRFLPLMN